MVKRGNLPILNQLIESLDEAVNEFEDAYYGNDYASFINMKKFIITLQKKIFEITK